MNKGDILSVKGVKTFVYDIYEHDWEPLYDLLTLITEDGTIYRSHPDKVDGELIGRGKIEIKILIDQKHELPQ